MKRKQHLNRRHLLLGAGAAAVWFGREPLRTWSTWLTTRPVRHLVVYIDTTDSASKSLRADRLSIAWKEAEQFLRSTPPGSTAEFFGTGVIPGEPEELAPFSPLEPPAGRLSRMKAEALQQSLESSLQSHAPGSYSCIAEDCYKLMQRDYGDVPVELVVISDLRQFTYPHGKNDHRLRAGDYLLLRDLINRPEWVAARFPKPGVGPHLIRVHYMPPQAIDNRVSEQIKAAWRQLFLAWVDNDPRRLQGLGPETE